MTPPDLPAITFGDSDQLEVGDVVLAIGNPFGVGQSVTMGIVSALGRNGCNSACSIAATAIQDFIQTDAAINPGNSGGALVDADGRLIGINTMIKSDTGGTKASVLPCPSISRATSWNASSAAARSLAVISAFTCRTLMPISPGNSTRPARMALLVDDVFPGTPADKAGIKAGDFVTEFNGKEIERRQQFATGRFPNARPALTPP